MNSLSKRLSESSWADEWPAGAVFGEVEGWQQPSSWLPHAMEWYWTNSQKVVRALTVEGALPVPLDLAHRTLDQLEEWTVRNRTILTWPATPLSFARALVHSVTVGDGTLATVIASYPAYCERMLDEARVLDPKIPEFTSVFGLKGYRKVPRSPAPEPVAAPESPVVEQPVGSSPEVAAAPPSAPAPSVAPPSAPAAPVQAEKPAVEAPPVKAAEKPASQFPRRSAAPAPETPVVPSPLLMGWVKKLEDYTHPVLASQFLDQQVKDSIHASQGPAWPWFDQVFLPALFTLPEKEMSQLLDHWPSHTKFKPTLIDHSSKLSEWFDQKRLWAWWRDAGPERQTLLANGGLAKIIDGSAISVEDMPDFLGRITMYAKTNSRSFRQRLQLWESLGGKLDEPIPSSPLLEAENVTTVRQWIVAQNNAEWNSVLETVAPEEPAPRRSFGRGPGR